MHAPSHASRIGPNAITRLAEALQQRLGATAAHQVFQAAGLLHHLQQPPEQMVDEAEVRHLHQALRAQFDPHTTQALSRDAGLRTARYLLARRIPRPVQALLKALPAPLAARLLLSAIARHAWTFAGSGTFSHQTRWIGQPGAVLTIRNNPLCKGLQSDTPACDYYAATFEHLFQQLVHRRSRVQETTCEATGASACRFDIRW